MTDKANELLDRWDATLRSNRIIVMPMETDVLIQETIEYLKQTADNNPLTIDELKEMQNGWVWDDVNKVYYKVQEVRKGQIYMDGQNGYTVMTLYQPCRFYRRETE